MTIDLPVHYGHRKEGTQITRALLKDEVLID